MFRIICLLVLLHFLPATENAHPQKHRNNTMHCLVTRIVDGDTFWAEDINGKSIKIRLIGVDAPETRNTGKKERSPYGDESALFLSKLIGGKRIRLEFDVSRYDRYGRTLAYVFLDDGTFVNAELLKRGYATVMTVPPNVRHADSFVRLAARARANRRGLWQNK